MPSLFKRLILISALLLLLPPLGAWLYLAQPTLQHNRKVVVKVDPQELEKHVRKLAVDFHPRNYLHLDNLDASASYIQKAFAAAGAETSIQSYRVSDRSYQNVIARFGVSKPETARWIVGAHYDACRDTPGADDNGSGMPASSNSPA